MRTPIQMMQQQTMSLGAGASPLVNQDARKRHSVSQQPTLMPGTIPQGPVIPMSISSQNIDSSFSRTQNRLM